MTIEINNSKTFYVQEVSLVVKNNKLFNATTNEYEALDGDNITFCALDINGNKYWVKGIVDGYTCNRRVKLKGIADLFACALGTKKTIVHNSIITDSDCEIEIYEQEEETMDEEWAEVLA